MGRKTKRKKKRKESEHQAKQLRLEQLEDRRMLAQNILYLDFDPNDVGTPPPNPTTNDFNDIFSSAYWIGGAPDFLDVATEKDGRAIFVGDIDGDRDWDGDVDLTKVDERYGVSVDALWMQARIVQKVRSLLSDIPNLEVRWTRDGWGQLESSRSNNAENTFVIFVGDVHTRPGVLGVTSQAPIAENNEWFGWVYAGNIAQRMVDRRFFESNARRDGPDNYNTTSKAFRWHVSATIAHEFGHMAGLGHLGVLAAGAPTTGYDPDIDFIEVRQAGPQPLVDPLRSIMASGSGPVRNIVSAISIR